ncbi:MAG: lysophospholipid acyltransferase family protein [Myxococcota bacterium]
MLDLKRLKKLRLHRRPFGQVVLADTVMRVDYNWPRPTEIILEGVGNIPVDRPVFFAMNHTDRYNYWPFQYQMYRQGLPRFTATWVKGKYYENAVMARFFDATNNIPVPSRGYVITTEFRKLMKRPPSESGYRTLRDIVDGKALPDIAELEPEVREMVERFGDGERANDTATFRERFDALFDAMMQEVVRLNRAALFTHDCNVLVFPEGTRSVRLQRGFTGLMQMAQHVGVDIVCVGSNGADKVYPGNSPLAKGGRIVYRIAPPLSLDGPELGPYRVRAEFTPFTRQATDRHGDAFEGATRVMMARISELLDPEYRSDGTIGGTQGAARFM